VPDQTSAAFISYCRTDEEFALRLAQDLKDAGAAVWLDQIDIIPGHSWDNAVEGALRAATKMLVILTPTSVSSENVRDEIAYALKQGKIVIPVLYMECEIPLRLERKQHIDFRANYAHGVDLLLRELRVDHSNQTALDRAAEGDVQRQLASQARDAEAERGRLEEQAKQKHAREAEAKAKRRRLEEQAKREQAREAEAERLRLEEQAKREQAREAEAARLRLEEQAKQKQAREAEAARLRLVEQAKQEQARQAREETLRREQEAEPQSDIEAAALEPWLWRRSSRAVLGGGLAAILIVGFVILRMSSSSQPDTQIQPSSVVAQPTPEPAIPQPAEAAPAPSPSPSTTTAQPSPTREQNRAKADITPAASTPALPQPAPESKSDLPGAQDFTLSRSKRYAEAVPLLTQGCDGGDPSSCNLVGAMYAVGTGVPKDYGKASTLYGKACDGGNANGCNNLGILYENGTGVPKGYFVASTLFTKACEGGNANGCNNLGILYENGMGAPKDYGKANTLYTKACDGGDPEGCNNVGVLYANGTGVAQDTSKAVSLFTKSCNFGYAAGCSNLSTQYHDRLFDFERALSVAQKAVNINPSVNNRLNLAEANLTTSHFDTCLQLLANISDMSLTASTVVARDVLKMACQWGSGADSMAIASLISKEATRLEKNSWNSAGDLHFLQISPAFKSGREAWIALFTSLQAGDSAGMVAALHKLGLQ
jgi:uncharacterized protein